MPEETTQPISISQLQFLDRRYVIYKIDGDLPRYSAACYETEGNFSPVCKRFMSPVWGCDRPTLADVLKQCAEHEEKEVEEERFLADWVAKKADHDARRAFFGAETGAEVK